MNAVVLTVKASYVASTKYQKVYGTAAVNSPVVSWRMKAPEKKPLVKREKPEECQTRVRRGSQKKTHLPCPSPQWIQGHGLLLTAPQISKTTHPPSLLISFLLVTAYFLGAVSFHAATCVYVPSKCLWVGGLATHPLWTKFRCKWETNKLVKETFTVQAEVQFMWCSFSLTGIYICRDIIEYNLWYSSVSPIRGRSAAFLSNDFFIVII